MMPGRQIGDGAKQLAVFFLFIFLFVFFALAIRTEWDRREGKAIPTWGEVLKKRMARNPMAPSRSVPRGPRQGDVL